MTPDVASRLVGQRLRGSDGRELGAVDSLVLDRDGRARRAVVDWSGFLGIGERQAVAPLERVQVGEGDNRARLGMTCEQLDALPRFGRGRLDETGREQGRGDGLRLGRN
jgi:hypothetical protein